jgi:pSer/pThr/pTyr-binding forkhead associated (FHA) protein
MRLVVKQDGQKVNELRFTAGPVYIGRGVNSQVFLPDRAVSRQHAVIFTTQDGKWIVEDLDSANKTYLNDKQIRKVEIKTGDVLNIADFTIEIDLESGVKADEDIHMEDTLITTVRQPQIIVRKADVEHAPDIRLPAKRAKDFLEAAEAICKADSPAELLDVILNITLNQFAAFHSWCALRDEPTGAMIYHAGRRSDGQELELDQIKLKGKITQAVETGQFLLLPQATTQTARDKIRSAMVSPIINVTGCFGVVYVDNAVNQQCYSLGDLDYLMLLAIHTAAILENF